MRNSKHETQLSHSEHKATSHQPEAPSTLLKHSKKAQWINVRPPRSTQSPCFAGRIGGAPSHTPGMRVVHQELQLCTVTSKRRWQLCFLIGWASWGEKHAPRSAPLCKKKRSSPIAFSLPWYTLWLFWDYSMNLYFKLKERGDSGYTWGGNILQWGW